MKALRDAFLKWCDVEPGFRNSPDIINLRFWFRKRGLEASETAMHAILSSIRPQRELTDEDIFGKGEEENMSERKRNSNGKPAAEKLLKELKRKTTQGKLIRFVLEESGIVEDILDNFMIERHTVMTMLNTIARNTGIGYSVMDDVVRVTLPIGVDDPFEL